MPSMIQDKTALESCLDNVIQFNYVGSGSSHDFMVSF
jgi:hypothetical protein